MNAADSLAPRGEQVRVTVLHRQQLVADAFAAVLRAMSTRLVIRSTTDPREALRTDGSTDILLAEQRLVPPGLRWHRFAQDDGAPSYIALGDVEQGPPVSASVAAIRAGARAWVPPDITPQQLLEVVEVVLSGQMWLPAPQVDRILHALTSERPAAADPYGLTARERTVLELLSAGRSTREIARMLTLSPNTVRTHRQRLFVKLGVHSAVEAAAWLRANLENA
jgi:DNA-binding NarL/FixJ family response regulator